MAKKHKPLPELAWLAPRLRISRALSMVCYVGLIALLLVWNLFFANLHGASPWLVITIQLVPLLLVAPGLIAGSPRAHAWGCFIINLYFIQGVLAAIDPTRALYGWLEAILSFAFFVAALLYTRWAFQYSRKAAGEN